MNRRRDMRAALVLFLVMLVGLLYGSARRVDAMVPEDILTMRTVGVAALSSDGRFLLYTLSAWDEAAGQKTSTLFRRDLETGRDLLVFSPADNARGAVWRPDGEFIAYLRQGDESVEIWLMDRNGGDRRRVAGEIEETSALHWSPDGSALAWVAAGAVAPYVGEPGVRVVADHLGYRHLGDGYRQGQLGQLYVLELDTGEAHRVVDTALDVRACSWSPDSRQLVFEAKAQADLGRNLNTDLWRVAREGGTLTRLTANPGADHAPRWLAPDRIAYLRATAPLWESAPNVITVIAPRTGDAELLEQHGTGLDNRFWRFAAADGEFYVLLAERGCLDLVRVWDDHHEKLTDGGFDFWTLTAAGGRVVMSGASPLLPSGIFAVDLNAAPTESRTARLLIDPNADWRERVGLTDPEPFAFEVDGRRIEGWFFKPADLEPGQKAPLVLSIHGGPEWMYGGYFLPEFHILPRFGYGVVIANPTGSIGYGFAFQKAIRGDWVDRPAREVMACVDLAVGQGWADAERLAVMGGSYGGHLGAALTTQTTRFRAAALDRMYPELVSFWGTTDEKWFPEWEFMGKPWEPAAVEVYRRNSPFGNVDRVRTPTLISHGLRDYRCLVAGGEIWFSALQVQDVPSRFIRFENEGHGIKDPANQVFYMHQVLNWFDQHVLGPNGENGTLGNHD